MSDVWQIRRSRAGDLDTLVALWERSVRATHDFLTDADIDALRPLVRDALNDDALELWVLTEDVDVPIGFMGLAGHDIAARQQDGFGAMVSFDLRGGEQAVRAFVDGLSCFTLAESLGGVESLVAHPATMTHAAMSEEARKVAGIGPGLIRLSVGIEHVDDLSADLTAALDRALACTKELCR